MPAVPKAETCVNIPAFEHWRDISFDKLNVEQRNLLHKVILDLKFGADAQVDMSKLPALQARNSRSIEMPDVGELFTDQLVSWIKAGFVLGKFYLHNNKLFSSIRLFLYKHFFS